MPRWLRGVVIGGSSLDPSLSENHFVGAAGQLRADGCIFDSDACAGAGSSGGDSGLRADADTRRGSAGAGDIVDRE